MPGRCSFLAASSPAWSSVVVASTAEREVRGAQQRAAHLLEHDGELDEGEALAAELLGDDEALQAQLVGHLAPHGGVVALVGVHQATDLGLGRLALEELAGDAAELFLLLGEGEVHGGLSRAIAAARRQPECVRMRTLRPMEQIGTRELRANLAAAVRQAGAGERVVITLDGRPVAQLGPLEPAGAAVARASWPRPASSSRRGARDRPPPPDALDAAVDVRLDRVLAEVRGGVTLYVDTSALVRRYLPRPAPADRARRDGRRRRVVRVGARCAPRRSSRCTAPPCRRASRSACGGRCATSGTSFWVVPIDDRCMARAVEIGATYGVRIVDAIHLAAADRLPAPGALPHLRPPADPGRRRPRLRGGQRRSDPTRTCSRFGPGHRSEGTT